MHPYNNKINDWINNKNTARSKIFQQCWWHLSQNEQQSSWTGSWITLFTASLNVRRIAYLHKMRWIAKDLVMLCYSNANTMGRERECEREKYTDEKYNKSNNINK